MISGASSMGIHLSYDAVPYPSLSYSQSHPDQLATLALLLGFNSPPVERCRVLELGCASGGNLIPMAYGLPESEFLGIDSAPGQIAQGQENVAALALKNIALREMDILDVSADTGQFDYIIAHGIYSWVPPAVQDKILEIIAQNMAPNGVAYVSYNVYPGWHLIDMVRGMMLYHTRETTDPLTRATEARDFLAFLAQSVPSEKSAYGGFLKMYDGFLRGETEGATPKDDALLLHDELEAINEPLYFFQFAERAARHGLQYLGDAEFPAMLGTTFAPEVNDMLGKMAKSVVDLEQYMDFLRNRTFRRTLLCHREMQLRRDFSPDLVKTLHMASNAKPETPDPDIHSVSVVQFRGPDGAVLSIDHPVSKAAMLCLADAWPRALPFDELLSAAVARLSEGAATQSSQGAPKGAESQDIDARVLAANMLKAYGYSGTLVDLHVHVPSICLEVSERPVVSPVACLQAKSSDWITNLFHQRVELDTFDRFLLGQLDGSRDRKALLDFILTGPVADGALTVRQKGKLVEDAEEIERLLVEELEAKLHGLARSALLVG